MLALLFMCVEFFVGMPDKENCAGSHFNYLRCCRDVQKANCADSYFSSVGYFVGCPIQ